MPPLATRWTFPLVKATEDKEVSRSSLEGGGTYELLGWDGNEEGPLRPFPGFVQVAELGPESGLDTLGTGHGTLSRLLDVFPVNFRVGSTAYAYGFVYRVAREDGINADIFVDFVNSVDSTWQYGVPVQTACAAASKMSVSVWGRFVYLFAGDADRPNSHVGRPPSMFYATLSSTGSITVVGRDTTPYPGPGVQPELIEPSKSGLIGALTTLGTRSGRSQIVLTSTPPSTLNIYTCTGGSGGTSGTGSAASGSGGYVGIGAFSCCGPGGPDVPPQTDSDARLLPAGNYTFAYYLFDSRSGRRSAVSNFAPAQPADFSVGGGAQLPRYAVIEISYDPTLYDQAYVYRSVRVEGVGTTYTAGILQLEAIITLASYATCRSPYSANLAQSVYYYTLEDKSLASQAVYQDAAFFDEVMPQASASIMYEGTMYLSKITANGTNSSSLRNTADDTQRGQGEMRWSSLVYQNPELFPPNNRYYPPIPTNEIITFEKAGGSIIGFSADRQYFIRKDNTYSKTEEMLQGFGVTGTKALASMGNIIYFTTPKGIKAVDSQGQLDDVRVLNRVVGGEWPVGDLASVSMAYDPAMSTLFVLNSVQGKCVAFWFNTARVIEYQDFSFKQVCRGVWPLLDSSGDNQILGTLVERAFFVQDFPYDDSSDEAAGWRPRVFIVNKDRVLKKTIMGQNQQTTVTLLPLLNDAYFTVTSVDAGGARIQITVAATGSFSSETEPHLPSNIEGAWLYVLSGDTGAGQRLQIRKKLSDTEIELTAAAATGYVDIAAGARIVISPIYTRWVGRPLRSMTEGEQQFASDYDYFRTKHVNSMGIATTGVTGTPLTYPASNQDVTYKALLYVGDQDTPTYTALPRDHRAGAVVNALREGESTYWASFGGQAMQEYASSTAGRHGVNENIISPGFEIVAADVDFKVLSASVTGRIEDTARTQQAS